ncbi:(d)CMP kinase [Paenibacillus sp. ACRRX]|uniref:(d)CMP kinase n=1 Tax=unclassified Paenibacillus TaxID=185978 RepID=UPI001EF46C90|nr:MULTISPECIES: (d)CMP kinase [unclassified Paenibacillus]MCG7406424.1 (d)CMP kinase [Paenibacillus sp. ACRRX]MDK8179456.1 (d)CMP kinase [Paenibacillus sp. UMB4589-SE434]
MKDLQEQHQNRINIAIDGPAGAGKSTVARHVARQLGYIYIDTGAMYRAVALHMRRLGIKPEEADRAQLEMNNVVIELQPGIDGQRVFLNHEDVTDLIRTPEVSQLASSFAQLEGIRSELVRIQRLLAAKKGIVMDGRDIGTSVLPQAEMKWFLTASVEERARRRHAEWQGKETVTLEQLMHDIAARDKQDETRAISPLKQAADANLLDTTHLNVDQIVQQMVEQARLRMDGEQ